MDQPTEDWVEIITADGERGRVTSATARHMITHHRARMATSEPPAGDEINDTWDDDGGPTT